MKNNMFRLATFLLFALGFSTADAQSCYVFKDDASGIDVQASQAELEAKACELVAAFDSTDFANQFKVFSFGFYMQLENYDEYSYPQAFLDMKTAVQQESPFYLLIGRQSDPSGIFTKFWVEVKLPETDKFWCMSEFDRIVLNAEISEIINQKYTGLESNFFVAEMAGMDSLASRILDKITCCGDDPQAKSLCGGCLLPNQILTILNNKKFVKIDGVASLDIVPNSPSSDIEDFANPIVDIDGKLKNMIEFIQSKGFTAKGFITENNGVCSPIIGPSTFNQAEQGFNTSQAQYNIWLHLWKNPATAEFVLYERISNYKQFLHDLIPYGVGDDDDETPCHGTKRALNIGLPRIKDLIEGMPYNVWEGKLAHIIVGEYYMKYNPLTVNHDTYAEYYIPNSSLLENQGYADLVDLTNGHLFEVKSSNPAELAFGATQAARYVLKGNLYCRLPPHPPVPPFILGTNFTEMMPRPFLSGKYIRARLVEPGLVAYSIHDQQTEPIFIPEPPISLPEKVFKKIEKVLEKIEEGVEESEEIVKEWLVENPETAELIVAYAATLITATAAYLIIQNMATFGTTIPMNAFFMAAVILVIDISREIVDNSSPIILRP